MHNSTVFPQKSVIFVDDGVGSGYSMLAAADFLKKKAPPYRRSRSRSVGYGIPDARNEAADR